ncbi:NAD(P)H-binding protein [Exiguobacterium flavidum]|uniref:NAD(P)H-binding protein n=1 Tax=Exiguobacterium flavidum TaxID=2184695 RepID=UPI000DF7C326|nr:NAD(P)H-binding protein [Exiguobacterium flavidum]
MEQTVRKTVALAGATGYIGHNLLDALKKRFDIIALSRNGNDKENEDHVTWRSCDLFSLEDTKRGLEGAEIAIYLVHSMMPSAKLTQGKFEDMDLLLADNFARAAKSNGVRQILYLSGIIPDDSSDLSRHLKSRLEVERALSAYGTPVTTIRAGLIVGPKGSSFPILSKLVKRLPVMVLPSWTRTRTHPIALPDVIASLEKSTGRDDLGGKAIDVGGPETMTYREMIEQTAEVMGRHPLLINFPFPTVKLSRFWVTLVTGTPKETAYPLIESMVHPMVAKEERKVEGISEGRTSFRDAAKNALDEEKKEEEKKSSKKKNDGPEVLDVRSVQRLILPGDQNARWAAREYVEWLGHAKPLLRTEIDAANDCRIFAPLIKNPLLELTYVEARDDAFAMYRITGGLFATVADESRGRIEFRQIPGTQECIIAIHEFVPALPWIVYRMTQANVHLFVMFLYKLHLERLAKADMRRMDLIVPEA